MSSNILAQAPQLGESHPAAAAAEELHFTRDEAGNVYIVQGSPLFQAHRHIDAQIDKLLALKHALIRHELGQAPLSPESPQRSVDVAVLALETSCKLREILEGGQS